MSGINGDGGEEEGEHVRVPYCLLAVNTQNLARSLVNYSKLCTNSQ